MYINGEIYQWEWDTFISDSQRIFIEYHFGDTYGCITDWPATEHFRRHISAITGLLYRRQPLITLTAAISHYWLNSFYAASRFISLRLQPRGRPHASEIGIAYAVLAAAEAAIAADYRRPPRLRFEASAAAGQLSATMSQPAEEIAAATPPTGQPIPPDTPTISRAAITPAITPLAIFDELNSWYADIGTGTTYHRQCIRISTERSNGCTMSRIVSLHNVSTYWIQSECTVYQCITMPPESLHQSRM